MAVVTQAELDAVRQGRLDVLTRLDDRGLLLGPGESLSDYVTRLTALDRNLRELATAVSTQGTVELLGLHLRAEDSIPPAVFTDAQAVTREHYAFAIDWVPGFYTNQRMGLLFAGCAFYAAEDFFALFLLRKAFKTAERWLIYGRRELMAHELCHVARVAFAARDYEELLAYQTATSGFRRAVGGLLRSGRDTALLMGAALLLLAAQCANVALRPPEQWNSFPMPLIFAGAACLLGGMIIRYGMHWRRFRQAERAIAQRVGTRHARHVLFRCSDAEIRALATCRTSEQLKAWLSARAREARWQVILEKFSSPA
jgi:hypothetical protein